VKINDLVKLVLAYSPEDNVQRRGQYLFNCLYAVRPDVADAIRGTLADPFYDDKKIPACWERIVTLW
jgi:hypothetical protein